MKNSISVNEFIARLDNSIEDELQAKKFYEELSIHAGNLAFLNTAKMLESASKDEAKHARLLQHYRSVIEGLRERGKI